ncbi:unnamed protein product [Urochloa decumbens]|uniref:F-box domain-containing protein n=1 Tax=Urochloa decumbens TaxID=240449 RepID=A0ABC9FX82_9POAL
MASLIRLILRFFRTEAPPRHLPALTDDLLQEIFVRIGSPVDLVRASTACVAFRRLIVDTSFLRRYRAIHPPLLIGFISDAGLLRAEPPHPSSPAAHAANFSFNDYLPPGRGPRWRPTDVRDGRVLLYCMPKLNDDVLFPDLAVCDPLSRQYMLLPPIPDGQVREQLDFPDFLLVPSGPAELETSFRVICCMRCMTRLVVFIYSSVSGYWTVTTSPTWPSLGFNVLPPDLLELETKPQCVNGCFYWQVEKMNKLLKLEMTIMEFSIYDLPPDHDERIVSVVEGGEGKLALFSQKDGTSVEYYTLLQDGNGRANEWHMENSIPLPFNYNSYIAGSGQGYIFLAGTWKEQDTKHTKYFSLEIKTFNIQRVCMGSRYWSGYPYFGFPPFMSASRIQGCEVVGF